MHKFLRLWILALCLVTTPAFCEEVGYVFSNDGDFELTNVNVSKVNLTDTVNFTTAGTSGSGGSSVSAKKVDDLQHIFDQRIEAEKVFKDAQKMIVGAPPGSRTIDQVCLIYGTIKSSWHYQSDPRGGDYYRFANETLQDGRDSVEKRIGVGDCDDFALLMASMIESIGGSTRVMLAYDPTGSHAYAEVYLGKIENYNVNEIKKWLMLKYGVSELYTHKDKETGEIWLNLDWGKNIAAVAYPGSAFFSASEHIPIYIKKDFDRDPLNPSTMALFANPQHATAGEPVNFNASQSLNIDEINEFEWDFGEGKGKERGQEFNVSYAYANGGVYNVILKVKDNQGAENTSTSVINVNNPPRADFTVNPEKPKLDDLVTFDSLPSNDSDGKIVERYWNLDNKVNSREGTIDKRYSKSGLYWVNLTVVDDKGARRTKSLHMRVNQPPVAKFVADPKEVNVGEIISFDATSSLDPDGETLVNFTWDFGDEISAENKNKVGHAFTTGGDKTVTLIVEDNDSAKSDPFSDEIKVNHPPSAEFTYLIKEGLKIEFNASLSKDEDGEIARYEWDFGDYYGPQGSKKSKMVHNYDEPGQYTVTLTVTDDNRSTGIFSKSINLEPATPEPPVVVEPTNEAPIAEFSYTVDSSKVSFDASASRDPDGIISRYKWDFGDDTGILEATKSRIVHNYDDHLARYNRTQYMDVSLTVTDDKGLTGSFSQTIDLQPPEPAQPVETENQPHVANFTMSSLSPNIGQSHKAALSLGWDIFSEPLSNGEVLWTVFDNRNLQVNFELNGASPNHKYIVGAHFFDPDDSSNLPCVCQFGGWKISCDRILLNRDGKTATQIGCWDFGYLETNGTGYGKAQFNLTPPPGIYYVQFNVRIGDQCDPSGGITSGCSAVYRTGNKYGEGFEVISIG